MLLKDNFNEIKTAKIDKVQSKPKTNHFNKTEMPHTHSNFDM